MISMVVFDMAGTTVNEDNVVYKTLQKAINEKGFDFTLHDVLLHGAGKEKLQAIKDILGTRDKKAGEELHNGIYRQFSEELATAYQAMNIFPQDNAAEVFRALKQRHIAVVLNTGYNRNTALLLLSRLGWNAGEDFDALVTASDVVHGRPGPDMIFHAMKILGIESAGQVVKVGDSVIDIEEGRNAGCRLTVGITTGAHTRDQLASAGPDYIIDNLLELPGLIDPVHNVHQD